jgi:uncharacterized repeat protein (TIGR04052 family)
MSLNPRPKWVARRAALALACSLSGACGDSQSDILQSAGTRDTEAAGGKSGGAAGAGAGKAGAGGIPAQSGKAVTIQFRAAVAERDFSCLERYDSVGSTKTTVVPADFRFYVQDLKLIDAKGKEVPVELDERAPWQTPDVALIDFEDRQGHCHGTPETNTTITGRVPQGEYTGVVFTNGVPESLNHLEQSKQPAPLDLTDLYWAWLSGYRFMVAELIQDADAAAANADDAGLALPGIGLMHIGSTACKRDMGCTKPNRNTVRLTDYDPSSDVIVADIAAIFAETDLSQDMQCHSADAICAPMFERVGVKLADGKSLETQKLYRVEKAKDGE